MKRGVIAILLFAVGVTASAGEPAPSAQKALTPQEKYERVQRMSVDELLSDLDEKPGALGIIHKLRRRGDKKAIPGLKAAFDKVSRKVEKQAIAAALVALGEEGSYLDFIVSFASAAVYNGMPVPVLLGDDGRPATKGLNPAFSTWCKEKGLDPNETATKAIYEAPSDVMILGLAGTRKAIPIFIDGLKSENDLIVKRSAQGLANLKHRASAKAILAATEKRRGARASLLAETLIYFDDADSAKGFEKNMENGALKQAVRKRVKEKPNQNVWGED